MSIHMLDQPQNSGTPISTLAEGGFAFVQAQAMRAILEHNGLRDWDSFAASWKDLGLDTYMADGGRYRRRRYSVFAVSADEIELKPHQPHFQSLDHNQLNGGVERVILKRGSDPDELLRELRHALATSVERRRGGVPSEGKS